jgi:predicted regulator of Ras-like GTPase activity (Roadblock/LC7/MglB family)
MSYLFLSCTEKKNRENIGKLAAVSSSILAMVQAFMHEIDLQDCQSLTLDAANGKALLTAVPHPQYPMVIMTLSAKDVLLGQLLFFVKKVSENILQYNLPE